MNIKISILLIVIIGGFLRISGADWGFPLLGHPDEYAISNYSAKVAGGDGLDPGIYLRPNHFSIYTHALLYHTVNVSLFSKPLQESYKSDKLTFYKASRILNGLFGTAMILVGLLIACEYNARYGLLAALLIAVYPAFVQHSHYITPDITLTLFTMLNSLYAIKYLKKRQKRYLFGAIVFAALAVSEKYPGVVTVFVIAGIILADNNLKIRKKVLYLFLSAVLFNVLLFIFSPYLYINFDQVLEAYTTESRSNHAGADGLGALGNIVFYFDQYTIASGLVFLALTFLGYFLLFKKHGRIAIPLLVAFAYLILFAWTPLHWERWGMPIYCFFLLTSAFAIVCIYDQISGRVILSAIFCLIIGIPIVSLSLTSFAINREFNVADSRVSSLRYCDDNGITKSNSYYEHYTPFAPTASPYVRFKGHLLDQEPSQRPFRYVIVSSYMYDRFYLEPFRHKRKIEGYEELKKYKMVKDFNSTKFAIMPNLNNYVSRLAFKKIVLSVPPLINLVTQNREIYSGPEITIYDLENKNFPKTFY